MYSGRRFEEKLHEQIRIDRRFSAVIRQISEISSFVRVLTERITTDYHACERSTPNLRERNERCYF